MVHRKTAAIVLLIAVAVSLLASSIAVATSTTSLDSKWFVIVLPSKQPDNPKAADAVIDVLIYVNKYSSKLRFYMLLADVHIDNTTIPAGSILVEGSLPKEIAEIANKFPEVIKVIPLSRPPTVSAILIRPPRIALFDNGALESISLPSVLKKMGFGYDILPNSSITKLLRGEYDLLILPPGSGTRTALRLGPGGARIVAEFVYRGGGLIGICAGAYAVIAGYNDPTKWIQLVDAKLRNWPIWWLGTGIVYVNITFDNPITFGFRGVVPFIYWNGPVMEPYDLGTNTTLGIDVELPKPIAVFVSASNRSGEFSPGWGELNLSYVDKVLRGGYAIVYSNYGTGRIVLFSVHPELTHGDLEYAPNSTLPSKYNWRMLWNAIYYVAGKRVLLGDKVIGTWMWPYTIRLAYKSLLRELYGDKHVDVEKKIEVLKQAIRYLVEELKSYGITDVFLLVKGTSGIPVWPSEVAKKYNVPTYCWGDYALEPYNLTNVVKLFADEAHRYGIRVHAWIVVNSDRVWGKRVPVYHCGKWKKSGNEYIFVDRFPVTYAVDLFNETYQNYIAELAKELVEKCDVDGIHLDYIRWRHAVYSFSPLAYRIAEENGINITKVRQLILLTFYGDPVRGIPPQPGLIFKLYYEKKDPDVVKWFELRRSVIVSILKKVKKAVEEVATRLSRKVILSAALMPEEAIDKIVYCRTDLVTGKRVCDTIPGKAWQWVHYGQHFEDFAKLGYWLIPMAYHREFGRPVTWVEDVARYVTRIVETVNPSTRALIGVQGWNVPFNETMKAIDYGISGGVNGYVVFRWGVFRKTAWNYLSVYYLPQIKKLSQFINTSLMKAAYIANYSSVLLQLANLSNEIAVVVKGCDYYLPNLSAVVNSITKNCIDLAKRIASIIMEKIEAGRKAVACIGGTYSVLYDYLSLKLEEMYKEIAESKSVDELMSIYYDFVSLASNTLLLVDIAKDIGSLRATVDSISRNLSEFSRAIHTMISSLNSSITSLGSKMHHLVKDLNSRIQKLTSEISSLSNTVSSIESKVAELSTGLRHANTSIKNVENNLSGIKDLARTALILSVLGIGVALLSLAFSIVRGRGRP